MCEEDKINYYHMRVAWGLRILWSYDVLNTLVFSGYLIMIVDRAVRKGTIM